MWWIRLSVSSIGHAIDDSVVPMLLYTEPGKYVQEI